MGAYSGFYVSDAMKNLGGMLDFAVHDCHFPMGNFLDLFIISGLADQFGRGNPLYVAGMSGEELAITIIGRSGLIMEIPSSTFRPDRSPEYWCGWILAYLQWETGWSFKWICQGCSAEDLLKLYPILHEVSEQKAASVLRARIEDVRGEESRSQTQLQRMRLYAGLTQAALAQKAGVSLRSIQMYEQRRKDINRAQAQTLFRLADVLGCEERDLTDCR